MECRETVGEMKMREPLRSQMMSGGGMPSATQVNTAVWFSNVSLPLDVAFSSSGSTAITAAATRTTATETTTETTITATETTTETTTETVITATETTKEQ